MAEKIHGGWISMKYLKKERNRIFHIRQNRINLWSNLIPFFLNLHCVTCNFLLPVLPSSNEWIQGRELFAFWKLDINRVAYANKVEKSIKGEVDQFSFWEDQFLINDRYMYNVSGEYYRYRFRNLWFHQVSVNCFIDWFST